MSSSRRVRRDWPCFRWSRLFLCLWRGAWHRRRNTTCRRPQRFESRDQGSPFATVSEGKQTPPRRGIPSGCARNLLSTGQITLSEERNLGHQPHQDWAYSGRGYSRFLELLIGSARGRTNPAITVTELELSAEALEHGTCPGRKLSNALFHWPDALFSRTAMTPRGRCPPNLDNVHKRRPL